MHHALRIDELLREIVGHLDRPSLVNVLRTCKSFYVPALDALWVLEQSLASLTGLLPPDVVCTESVPSLIALARAAAALATATTAIANVVEDDVETITAADVSIVAAHEVVHKLLEYVTWDQILLQPWYPSYRGLPDIRLPAINLPGANVNTTDNMRPPIPIKILNRDPTQEEVARVIRRSAHITHILYTPARRKHSLCSRLL
ncbi:hypothetical protein BS47DRAFT_511287 [Hydnum rufescens UP504]|uniref:F-box domain-containing protein n=1 Tax=Hydnum rufescens UP504 TaxID=1448309 RepID=A0A9P6AI54_9AGAM|nr:hypothetical protein BS47DRAFT_511287 [Hydnum rufescens UP504]